MKISFRFLSRKGRSVPGGWAVGLVLVVLVGCSKVEPVPMKTASADETLDPETFVAARPSGLPVSAIGNNGRRFDAFVDSAGTVIPAGVDFQGEVSALYNGLYVMGTPGQYNVYSLFNGAFPLNATPFDRLTDFRMGVAYGTRNGRGLMVVNSFGAVSRLLNDRVRGVTLPAPGVAMVDVATGDVPMKGVLTTRNEDLFIVTDTLVPAPAEVFWTGLDTIDTGNGYFRLFRRSDGKLTSDYLIRPYASSGVFDKVTTSNLPPIAAEDYVSGISSTGWMIDSSYYSASTPGWMIMDKIHFTPRKSLTVFDMGVNNVVRLPRPSGSSPVFMSLSAPPYVTSDTDALGLFSLWFATPEKNPESRLRSITMAVDTEPDFGRATMKAAEKIVLQRGFIGFADKSHAFKGKSETYLYFVPNDRGFFIVMAFGELDYGALMGTAMKTNSYNIIKTT